MSENFNVLAEKVEESGFPKAVSRLKIWLIATAIFLLAIILLIISKVLANLNYIELSTLILLLGGFTLAASAAIALYA